MNELIIILVLTIIVLRLIDIIDVKKDKGNIHESNSRPWIDFKKKD